MMLIFAVPTWSFFAIMMIQDLESTGLILVIGGSLLILLMIYLMYLQLKNDVDYIKFKIPVDTEGGNKVQLKLKQAHKRSELEYTGNTLSKITVRQTYPSTMMSDSILLTILSYFISKEKKKQGDGYTDIIVEFNPGYVLSIDKRQYFRLGELSGQKFLKLLDHCCKLFGECQETNDNKDKQDKYVFTMS